MDFQNRAFLNTREAARFLTDRGLPTSPATLDTKRTRGGEAQGSDAMGRA